MKVKNFPEWSINVFNVTVLCAKVFKKVLHLGILGFEHYVIPQVGFSYNMVYRV